MTIFIPTPLRPFAAGKDAVEVNAGTIAGALDELTQAHPDLRKHLFTSEGKVRAFVNIYLNDEDVRYLPAWKQQRFRPPTLSRSFPPSPVETSRALRIHLRRRDAALSKPNRPS
jgi:molybdopterin synthase sulfur carrier subunit